MERASVLLYSIRICALNIEQFKIDLYMNPIRTTFLLWLWITIPWKVYWNWTPVEWLVECMYLTYEWNWEQTGRGNRFFLSYPSECRETVNGSKGREEMRFDVAKQSGSAPICQLADIMSSCRFLDSFVVFALHHRRVVGILVLQKWRNLRSWVHFEGQVFF